MNRCSERNAPDAVAAALTGRGWTADAERNVPGLDPVATRDGRWLSVEVDGDRSTSLIEVS